MSKAVSKIRKRNMCRGRLVRHFKHSGGLTGIYQILEFARHTDTREVFVIYQNMGLPRKVWARPMCEFMAEVDKEKYPDAKQKYVFEVVSDIQNGKLSKKMTAEIQRLEEENARLKIEAHDLDSSGRETAKDLENLEKEADWLADYLCDVACVRDIKPCDSTKTCRDCWRDEARKAVKARAECPNIDSCNRTHFSADECNSCNVKE